MTSKNLPICLLAILLTFPPIRNMSAQQATHRIQILAEFDVPGKGLSTSPEGISNAGDIVGRVTDPTTRVHGFERYSDGSFAPVIEPNGDGKFYTATRGINSSGLICGYYLGTSAFLQGFFATSAGFTDYVVPGAFWTELYGVNDQGDFCGAFANSQTARHFIPFAVIGNTMTTFTVPGATTAFSYGINNGDQVVGAYLDSAGIEHGFVRGAAGKITAPIDIAGAILTIVFSLNDQGMMVGRFADSTGMERGFVMIPPDTVLVLEKPSATLTSLNGINNDNLVCGRWEDSSGIGHGVLAQVR